LNLDVDKDVHSDIQKFIVAKVDELASQSPHTQLSRATLERVRRRLEAGAKGTFLWVALVVNDLKDRPEECVEQVLQSVPEGLHGLYQRMLRQIRNDREKVFAILTWIVFACRPLT
jgi:hypothetical protein